MNWLKAYISFNRTERTGIIVLMAIIFLLLAIRFTMHFWVNNNIDSVAQKRAAVAWQQFKTEQNLAKRRSFSDTTRPAVKTIHEHLPASEKYIPAGSNAALFNFDPNTVDSASLRRLGLREKTTAIFLHWRAKGKRFYKKEDMRAVYTLTEEEYQRIAPYIRIDQSRRKHTNSGE